MKHEIQEAIKIVTSKCKADLRGEELMKISQAVLNLTKALETVNNSTGD